MEFLLYSILTHNMNGKSPKSRNSVIFEDMRSDVRVAKARNHVVYNQQKHKENIPEQM